MDSGLGSDDEKKNRTKAQKQLQNEQKQLFSGCFIDATSLGDDGEFEHRRNDERRQGALIFRSSIPQYSMLQMPNSDDQGATSDQDEKLGAHAVTISTPHNSIVQVEAEVKKTPVGFYVDLGEVEVDNSPPAPVEKKNIFSMVIDFNVPKREMPSRLSSSLYGRRKGSARSTLNSSGSNLSEGASCGYESDLRRDFSIDSKVNENLNHSGGEIDCNGEKSDCIDVSSPSASFDTNGTIDNNEECDQNATKDEHSISNDGTDKHTNAERNAVRPAQQFVKLSDLEAQSPRLDLFLAPRMSRSIPEKSWVESPLATFRSASYRSSPQPFADLNEPSAATSLSESTVLPPKGSVQRLGTDLLKMFLEEINTDVTLEVTGRKIRAHKCILSSRCHYFAAVFGGKSSENVVSIQGYSYAAVHFALCHIYSGAAHIPQSISLVELAALADMLGLEGLKEVVAHALKIKHCHNFHSPCSGCMTGVVEVLPLSAAYSLDELYQASLHWIMKHFVEVWPSRTFMTLPRELRDKCYQQHLVHMNSDNVLETVLNCDKLLATMPTAKWAETVAQLTLQLADQCQVYLRQNYANIIASPNFASLECQPTQVRHLENSLISAAGALKLEQACRGYMNCHKLFQKTWTPPFSDVLRKINTQIESCVVRQAAQASRSILWTQFDPLLRKRIRDLSMALTKKEPSSSSDSSRNSSPAIKNRTQVSSPSLRRSLLMAARASQTPPSPSTARKSTLTMPTQSSAAKSNLKVTLMSRPASASSSRLVSRNVQKTPVKKDKKEDVVPPKRCNMSVSTTSVPVKKSSVPQKRTNVVNATVNRPARVAPSTGIPTRLHKTPVQKNIKSPEKNSSKQKSPEKVKKEADVKETEKRSPGVRRSGTFLKDEPTVLGKIKQ